MLTTVAFLAVALQFLVVFLSCWFGLMYPSLHALHNRCFAFLPPPRFPLFVPLCVPTRYFSPLFCSSSSSFFFHLSLTPSSLSWSSSSRSSSFYRPILSSPCSLLIFPPLLMVLFPFYVFIFALSLLADLPRPLTLFGIFCLFCPQSTCTPLTTTTCTCCPPFYSFTLSSQHPPPLPMSLTVRSEG